MEMDSINMFMGNGSDEFTLAQEDNSSGSSKDVSSPAMKTSYDFSMDEVPDDIKGRERSNLVYLIPIISLILLIGGVVATVYILVSSAGGLGGVPLNPIEFVTWAIDTISGFLIGKLKSAFAV